MGPAVLTRYVCSVEGEWLRGRELKRKRRFLVYRKQYRVGIWRVCKGKWLVLWDMQRPLYCQHTAHNFSHFCKLSNLRATCHCIDLYVVTCECSVLHIQCAYDPKSISLLHIMLLSTSLTHSINTSDHMYPQVYLATEELGNSLDEVDALMKKHETVEKLLETQEQKARDAHIILLL